MLAFDDVEPANAGTNVNAYTLLDIRSDVQAGHLHGLICGRHAQMNEAAHLLDFFFLDEIQRIEVLDFGGDGACVTCSIKAGNSGNAAFACE